MAVNKNHEEITVTTRSGLKGIVLKITTEDYGNSYTYKVKLENGKIRTFKGRNLTF